MNREYALPGLVAIALAILFPLYWVAGLVAAADGSLSEVIKADMSRLSLMDGLFVMIGMMEVYLYLNLRRVLNQRLDGGLAGMLSLGMAIAVGIYTATILFDAFLALGPAMGDARMDNFVMVATIVMLVIGTVVAVIGLILSVALLIKSTGASALLKLFAVVLLVCSLLSLTIVLAPVVFVIYPVALVLLALWFLRGDNDVEVV